MRQLFDEVPEACDNTLWIAERANVEIEFGKPQLPDFPLPEGFADDADYLRAPHLRGRPRALGRASSPTPSSSGWPTSSRSSTTWGSPPTSSSSGTSSSTPATTASGSARAAGSAAGCAVAYCLRITDLDPIKYDLLFERFLNPRRISMPDIDMDFDSRYRDEMIRYAAERYGRDHVAQIVTFSTIKARAAVRDAARVLGYPYVVGDKVAKAMPPLVMGRDTPLYACLEKHREVRGRLQDGRRAARRCTTTDPDAKPGHRRGQGPRGPAPPGRHPRRRGGDHQGARSPSTCPIQRKPEAGQDPEDAPDRHPVRDARRRGRSACSRWTSSGLRNLDVITDTARADPARPGASTSTSTTSPLDDAPTYELLQPGRLDRRVPARGRRRCARSCARWPRPASRTSPPSSRSTGPGPMAANMHNDYADRKNGRKPVEYLHPDAEEMLGDTYGLMIYQESVHAGGPEVRRLLPGRGRQPPQGLRQEDPRADRPRSARSSSPACEATGYGADARHRAVRHHRAVRRLRVQQEPHLRLRLIAYQTAYLKANYPVEYLAALLTSVKANLDKAADLPRRVPRDGHRGARARRQPCRSPTSSPCRARRRRRHRDAVDRVRAVGGAQRRARAWSRLIVAEREANGPFADFYDFCERVDIHGAQQADHRVADQGRRLRLASATPARACSRVRADHRPTVSRRRSERDMGVMSPVRRRSRTPAPSSTSGRRSPTSSSTRRSGWLREGDARPLRERPPADGRRGRRCGAAPTARSPSSPSVEDGTIRIVGGVVTGLQRKWTKKGDLMAVFMLEDLQTVDRGHGLPQDDDRPRPQARRRRHRHRARPGSTAATTSPSSSPWRSSRSSRSPTAAPPLRIKVSPDRARPSDADRRAQAPARRAPGRVAGVPPPRRAPGAAAARRRSRVDAATGLVAELRVLLGPDAIAGLTRRDPTGHVAEQVVRGPVERPPSCG